MLIRKILLNCIYNCNFQYFCKRCLQTNIYSKSTEIKFYLQQKRIKFFDGWTCFQCDNFFQRDNKSSAPTKNSLSNCFINKTTGDFNCPSSKHFGSWETFKNKYQEQLSDKSISFEDLLINNGDMSEVKEVWKLCQPLNKLDFEKMKKLMEKYNLLTTENIDLNIFNEFNICCKTDSNELVVPFYNNINSDTLPKGLKVIHDTSYCLNEPCMNSLSAYSVFSNPNCFNLFGYDKLKLNTTNIVLTSNEFDTIAINALSSKYFAMSLPFGIANLPLRLLPLVEQFSEIILWFGNDFLSIEAAQLFANKLGAKRCRIVRPPASSPTALLAAKNGLSIDGIINSAVSREIKNVLTFSDLYGEVKDEILNKHKYAGVTFKRFSDLNMILKGHRPGELTILTGSTGSGKTTFLSELSLDLAMQGVRTLWGSFELSNKRLLISMLKQFSGIHIEQNMHLLDELCQKFKQLPITLMSYTGSRQINDVLKTMFEATYYFDIQHIVLDNLQFMMGNISSMDRFAYQDQIINKLREFATKHHVHITLVVHPRKESENVPLQLSSVFGSAKATQEADNVLIVQVKTYTSAKDYPVMLKYLEVAKNRYDGELGRVKLFFNKQTLQMSKSFQMNNDREIKDNLLQETNYEELTPETGQTAEDTLVDCGNKVQQMQTSAESSASWINRFRNNSN